MLRTAPRGGGERHRARMAATVAAGTRAGAQRGAACIGRGGRAETEKKEKHASNRRVPHALPSRVAHANDEGSDPPSHPMRAGLYACATEGGPAQFRAVASPATLSEMAQLLRPIHITKKKTKKTMRTKTQQYTEGRPGS